MKKIKIVILIILTIILIPVVALAHSGRTDSNGGHYDYSTGEYHYHHGYAAHQHPDGICPYEINYKNLIPSTCPKCKSKVNKDDGNYCFECGYKMLENPINVGGVTKGMFVSGKPQKTRSEYFEEVQSLNTKISEKENIINNLFNEIDEKNAEISNLKNKQKNSNLNLWIGFIFIFLIGIYISYHIGHYKDKIN